MTAQIAELLRYEGGDMAMFTTPLDDYFKSTGVDPGFRFDNTALWRGYLGKWEIRDGRLYLFDLCGTMKDGTEASLATFFPDSPMCVFAGWYTGELRIPQGRMLDYMHRGFKTTFEMDLLISVERGVVTGTTVRHNGKATDEA